jgi:hypothetical protein
MGTIPMPDIAFEGADNFARFLDVPEGANEFVRFIAGGEEIGGGTADGFLRIPPDE